MNVQGSDFGLFQTTSCSRTRSACTPRSSRRRSCRTRRRTAGEPGDAGARRHADAAPHRGAPDPAARARRPAEGRGRAHRAGRDDPRHAHRAVRHARPRRLALAGAARRPAPRGPALEGVQRRARRAGPARVRHRRRRARAIPRRARHGPRRARAGRGGHAARSPADFAGASLLFLQQLVTLDLLRGGRAQDAPPAAARPAARRARRRRRAGPAQDPPAGAGVRRRERPAHRRRRARDAAPACDAEARRRAAESPPAPARAPRRRAQPAPPPLPDVVQGPARGRAHRVPRRGDHHRATPCSPTCATAAATASPRTARRRLLLAARRDRRGAPRPAAGEGRLHLGPPRRIPGGTRRHLRGAERPLPPAGRARPEGAERHRPAHLRARSSSTTRSTAPACTRRSARCSSTASRSRRRRTPSTSTATPCRSGWPTWSSCWASTSATSTRSWTSVSACTPQSSWASPSPDPPAPRVARAPRGRRHLARLFTPLCTRPVRRREEWSRGRLDAAVRPAASCGATVRRHRPAAPGPAARRQRCS